MCFYFGFEMSFKSTFDYMKARAVYVCIARVVFAFDQIAVIFGDAKVSTCLHYST